MNGRRLEAKDIRHPGEIKAKSDLTGHGGAGEDTKIREKMINKKTKELVSNLE